MHLKGLARGEQEGTVTSVTWAHGPRTSDEANGTSGIQVVGTEAAGSLPGLPGAPGRSGWSAVH